MRRWLALLAMLAALNAVAQSTGSPPVWHGYDEVADARADVERGLEQAAASGRRVLIVFGANWCGDCRVLDLTMKQGRLGLLIDEKFVVVKVDVGRFNRNLEIAQRFGVPLKKGIPTVAVLRTEGRVSFVTAGGELASARSMGEEALVRFFDRSF